MARLFACICLVPYPCRPILKLNCFLSRTACRRTCTPRMRSGVPTVMPHAKGNSTVAMYLSARKLFVTLGLFDHSDTGVEMCSCAMAVIKCCTGLSYQGCSFSVFRTCTAMHMHMAMRTLQLTVCRYALQCRVPTLAGQLPGPFLLAERGPHRLPRCSSFLCRSQKVPCGQKVRAGLMARLTGNQRQVGKLGPHIVNAWFIWHGSMIFRSKGLLE